jgi:predicted RNA-binding protein with PUA-like domain
MEIVRAAHADMTAFDPTSDYYDPKSTPEHPRWYMVDVQYKKKLKTPITLTELRNHPALTGFTLLKRGNRLSVMSVSEQQWQTILAIPKRQ